MRPYRQVRGFTLIELIVVMGMLTIVMALTVPSLSRFTAGRKLEEEARRFLTLTRYARNEAISRAEPLELRVDIQTGIYGLYSQTEWGIDDFKPIEFRLADGLHFRLDRHDLFEGGDTQIAFLPDGILGDPSLERLIIYKDEQDYLSISRHITKPEYVIENRYQQNNVFSNTFR